MDFGAPSFVEDLSAPDLGAMIELVERADGKRRRSAESEVTGSEADVILRILRGRVVEGDEARLSEYIRDEAIGDVLRTPGLVSFQPALHARDGAIDVVIVSTWRSFDDLLARGRPIDEVITLPKLAGLIRDAHADHFEVVFGDAHALPFQGAVLRITDMPLRARAEAAYFERARARSEELLDEHGLVAVTLARRSVGNVAHAIEVTLWQDGAEGRVASSEVSLARESEGATYLDGSPTSERFSALVATQPRPDAPAILVANDRGQYVHATAAAAALTGHSLARLLTMTVSDVATSTVRPVVPELWDTFMAAGVELGEFDIMRPDASVAKVRFAAKTNTPWPGTHSSVLTPAGVAPFTDVDEALSQAGLVARYAVGV